LDEVIAPLCRFRAVLGCTGTVLGRGQPLPAGTPNRHLKTVELRKRLRDHGGVVALYALVRVGIVAGCGGQPLRGRLRYVVYVARGHGSILVPIGVQPITLREVTTLVGQTLLKTTDAPFGAPAGTFQERATTPRLGGNVSPRPEVV
jgi:hypothetical protein